MTVLPIVGRELVQAARRRGTYWLRVGAAGSGLLMGGWFAVFPGTRNSQSLGIALFVSLSTIVYIYCLFIGIFRTADCLSEEKREGTLGLLFLTDLRGYDIVFGKLVATSLNAFYGLLALFPIMAIPLLAGGVSMRGFERVALVAINTMFFSMALGMFASSISRDERRALVLALLLGLFFAGGVPLLSALLHDYVSDKSLAELLLVVSPGYAAVMAFDSPRGAGPVYFVHSVVTTHCLS